MQFLDDKSFTIGDIKFQTIGELKELLTLKDDDGFVLGKPKRFIEKYVEHLNPVEYPTIFELGIFRGGSTVFFNEFFKPRKLVAIDLAKKRRESLDQYIASEGFQDTLKAHYNVNQADVATLQSIWRDDFNSKPLDLVIDDASHYLEESRVSFNTLFPLLRTGGAYVIEDWSWAHIVEDNEAVLINFEGKKPLSNLVVEIMLASASTPGLIDEIIVTDGFAIVRKGALGLDQNFDVSKLCYLMGKPMNNFEAIKNV